MSEAQPKCHRAQKCLARIISPAYWCPASFAFQFDPPMMARSRCPSWATGNAISPPDDRNGASVTVGYRMSFPQRH
jgi:hypothetical protein